MVNELLRPLNQMIQNADDLLTQTTLNELQRKFIHSIFLVASELRALVISIPDLTWKKAQAILNYESRLHLASIIGYAEVLLDENEGELSAYQRERVHEIRSSGKQLLSRLNHISEGGVDDE
jgi:signal transduction histidine kinase